MAVQESQQHQTTPSGISRRGFLVGLGVALNALAAALLAIPIVGYVFSSFRYKTVQEWILLGSLEQFPERQTRLATYRNPFTSPWDGATADIPCWVRSLALWLDQRLHLTRLFASTAGHEVPASAHSWFYVFGSGTLLCFVIQIVTGICLAFVYAPTAHDAWTSLIYLNYQQPLGWYLRAMHYW